MLQQAGYPIKDGKRVDAKGEPVTIEFLIDEPTFQPHHMPFIKNLATVGIDATLRVVDPVQFRKRVDEFDFDITVQRFNFSSTPGDSLRNYFSSQSAKMNGSFNLAGISDPVVDALIEQIIARRHARRTHHRVPRARSRDPRRPLLDSALVSGGASDRLLGRVRLSAEESRGFSRGIPEPGGTIRRRRQNSSGGGSVSDCPHPLWTSDQSAGTELTSMTAYILRRILFMIPTLLGIMLVSFVVVQFAPGGPVERVIAQLSGSDTGATSRISGSQAATSARAGRRRSAAGGDVSSKYRGAQGLDPEFIKSLEKQFGFDKPAYERFALMIWNFATLRFRQELFPRHQRDPAHQGEAAGLDVARHLDDADDLPDLDPARHPQGGRTTARASTYGPPSIIIVGYAIPGFLFAILLIILFAGGSFWDFFPLRGLTSDNWAALPWYAKILDYFWHLVLPITSMALGGLRHDDAADEELVP